MRLPIRARMTAWYVALLAVVVAAVGTFLVVRLRADLTDSIDHALVPASDQIAAGYRAEGAPELRDTAQTAMSGERAAAQVLDLERHVLVSYGDGVAKAPMLTRGDEATVLGGDAIVRTVELGGQRFRVAARPVDRRGARQAIVAAQSLAGVERSVRRVLTLLLIAGPAALLATALGGWWLARRALRPIERMTARAAAIDLDRLEERVAVPPTGDEVARLATTLNAMLGRIEHGVREQHRLVADASHELRTPLASMRAELDVSLRADDLPAAARAVLESAREEVDRMTRTVDDLLVLASIDEGRLELLVEPLDLRDVAERAVAALRPLARTRRMAIVAGGEEAPAAGDAERIGHALRNLVENAIKFSPAGGAVEVTTWARAGEAGVTVRDAGPGVAPELRERIFDRFFRADPSRARTSGGGGLGLAIAREIAEAHEGRVWVQDGDGGGSAFSLALPARLAAPSLQPAGGGRARP